MLCGCGVVVASGMNVLLESVGEEITLSDRNRCETDAAKTVGRRTFDVTTALAAGCRRCISILCEICGLENDAEIAARKPARDWKKGTVKEG